MTSFGQKVSQLFKKSRGAFNGPAPLAKKASAVGKFLAGGRQAAFISFAAPRWTGRSYEQLVREGYRKNVVVHRCVRIISESAASVPFLLFRDDKRLDRHPLMDLLAHPNPLQSGKEMMANFFAFLEIAGNSYMEVVTAADGRAGELYVLRPERMKIVPGPNGWPARFEYKVGAKTHSFVVDAKTGKSPILHLKTFHPEDDHYGLSPLEPSAFGIDIHNSAASWNKALLDNSARPSGALTFEPADGAPGTLSDEQFKRLKDELEDNYQGPFNAGRPVLLEGGLKWQQMGLTPHDMDFIQSKNVSAREIALAFGVPPMILGIPGDNTYANYAEANRALWRLTLLPLLEKMCASLNSWLLPRFGPDLRLDYDRDAIPALTFEREAEWNRLGQAQFLTINEKRKALGFESIKGGDKIASSSFLPPGGGGSGFFSQGAGSQKGTSPKSEAKRGKELKASGRLETAACYSRHNHIHEYYKNEAAKDPNVSFEKVWRASRDSKTRFSHRAADGQTVRLDEFFTVGSEQLFLPCDLSGGTPGNVFGCRCQVEYRKIRLDRTTNKWNPEPVSNGNKAYLTDEEIAWSVYNEQRGLRELDKKTQGGVWLESARLATHVIINGEEKDGPKRPKTAATTKPTQYSPALEDKSFNDILQVVKNVKNERLNGIDAASKRIYFVQRYLCEPTDNNVCLVSGGNRCCFKNFNDLTAFPEPAIGNLMPWKIIGPLFNVVSAEIPKDRVVYMVAFDGTWRGQRNP